MKEAPCKIEERLAIRSVQDDCVPLTVPCVVEKIEDNLRAAVAAHIDNRMRAEVRPLLALFDILLDVAPPTDRQALRFRFCRIEIQHIDVTLKIAHSDKFHAAIAIHVGQSEPAIGATVVIAQFGLFSPGRAVENHDPVMCSYTDLRHAVAIDIVNHV